MRSKEFLDICKEKVAGYFNSNKDKTDRTEDLSCGIAKPCKTIKPC